MISDDGDYKFDDDVIEGIDSYDGDGDDIFNDPDEQLYNRFMSDDEDVPGWLVGWLVVVCLKLISLYIRTRWLVGWLSVVGCGLVG